MSQSPLQLVYTTQARKDAKNLTLSGLQLDALDLLLNVLFQFFSNVAASQKAGRCLGGRLYNQRLDAQSRPVYKIIESSHHLKFLRVRTRYEQNRAPVQY
ncbi:hypothetical protein [Polaromonas sp.]|uniref:hypothetical protein n=1 Tax=Polaromonas sp. TaxID=1869339 RepID=UPI0018569248|nr:hypothetical protein [Polaromonas sp.]NML86748.1 type II toxin-antitoxin system mRNA interferase toxin, RelE/StbE family [Polaromonas sp.]